MSKLNKFIADTGYCSRRKAADLVKAGSVTVNGQIIVEPFHDLLPTDAIKVQNKLIKMDTAPKLYFIVNKPVDVITTSSDPEDRATIMHYFRHIKSRLHSVGRLDRNTTGLILVTNDGDLTQKLTHPKFEVKKTYYVTTHKPVTEEHQKALLEGVRLEDGYIKVDHLHIKTGKKNTVAVTLHSGKKHVIKRLFKKLRYFVEKLDRVKFGTITKRHLALGTYRPLTQEEVISLKK